MTERLDIDEVVDRIEDYQGWEQQGHWVVKQFKFEDFQEALEFVNDAGEVAEDLNHHPDISLQNYNEVILNLTTHDVEGITEKDFDFIERIETEVLKE